MTKLILVSILLSVAMTEGSAQGLPDDAEAINSVSSYSDAALTPIDLVYSDVSKQLEDYLSGPVVAKLTGPGVHLEQGIAAVDVSRQHPDWAKHRVLAYKAAWANVQENFIRYQFNETSTELVRKLYADASGSIPEYAPESYTGSDAIDEFIEKSGAYVSSRLDKALTDVGVDPADYARADKKQRTKFLESAIRQKTVTRSVGKLTGLWPLMSFTGTVDDQYAIGVVGVYKPIYEEIATEIAKGRIPNASSKTGRPINERLPSDGAALSNSFGVRLVRDENGYPSLMSFGQWGFTSASANPAIRAKFRDIAIKQARSQADAGLALFLNGSANFVDTSLVGSVLEEYIDVDRSGFDQMGSSTEIQDMIDQVLTARANVKLSGLRDLRVWTYRHPDTGHDIVGVVRVWTPVDAMAARAIRSGPKASVATTPEVAPDAPADAKTTFRKMESSPAYADPDEI